MQARERKDHIAKRLFGDRRFVTDALRLVSAKLIGDFDLATLREASAEFIDRRGRRRLADRAWRVRRHSGGWAVALIEVESRDRPRMAARMAMETALAIEAAPQALLGPDRRLPAVLPLVVHVGDRPWTDPTDLSAHLDADDPLARFVSGPRYVLLDLGAPPGDDLPLMNRMAAFHRLHASASPKALFDELRSAFGWMGGEEVEVRQALLDWAVHVVLDGRFPEADAGGLLDWKRSLRCWKEERSAGSANGWRKQGKAQGRAEGKAQVVAHERGLLCRQAGRRFGANAGEQLAAALAGVSDLARLDQVGNLIVDCGTGEELMERLNGEG